MAATFGHTAIVRMLLQRAPNTAVDHGDATGFTAPLQASRQGLTLVSC
jgi:hypothetical protein